MDALPKIVELMSKMRRTSSRTLRKNYADQAKLLLKTAEKEVDKNNPAARAGLRRVRNELIQVLDLEFPEIARKDELKNLGGLEGQSCPIGGFGLFSNTTNIIKGCSWTTILGVGALLYLLGRSHRKAVAARRARKKRKK